MQTIKKLFNQSLFNKPTFNKPLINPSSLLSFLLFWYLTSITQLLISLSGAASFEGFKDATITAFLWMIPVLLFPRNVKRITASLGILLWVFALPGFGYYLIYHQELTQSLMFIIFESNQSESTEYLQNYLSIGIVLSFIAFTLVPLYIWTTIKPYESTRKPANITSFILITLIFMTPVKRAIQYGDINAANKNLNRHLSAAPPWQLGFGYGNYQRELKEVEAQLLNLNKIPALKNLTETKKELPTTVVLVIGESTTRVHMGLYGYGRDTTPKLSSMKNELMVFDNVFASRPNTIESLEQVLTFADQVHPERYKTSPSLIAMMKQAGYKTYWITNQQTLTKRNTMLTTFAKQADEQVFLNNARRQNAYSFDEKVLAPYAEKLLKKDEKKLIIVHLLGTHMKYAYRYPDSYDYFKTAKGIPAVIAADAEKVALVNAYDNAVRYNDYIVHTLIQQLKQVTKTDAQSLLVYFSDHGEDVYDSAPHSFKGRNEGAPTYPMYAVPLIVWHSANWQREQQLDDAAIHNRQYDNADFIYTWSDLMGLTYDGYRADKSLINDAFVDDTILVGDPYGKHLQVLDGTISYETQQKKLSLSRTLAPQVVTSIQQ
jgi:heptose-I-phosphate ethanolaminephosphotransferase